jgi:DNA primase
VYVRIEPRWDFLEVRRAALALAREVERRLPDLATSKWWKEERGTRVFLDYNQNARDRTIASAYSVRANPEGKVSCPVSWVEMETVEPGDLTIATVPARFEKLGDVGEGIDDRAFSLQPLLDLAARDEAQGLGDAPWPPHFPKQQGEPKRVQPSKARKEPEG